jgi:hypothetical protein
MRLMQRVGVQGVDCSARQATPAALSCGDTLALSPTFTCVQCQRRGWGVRATLNPEP